jgi:hypothetical protein
MAIQTRGTRPAIKGRPPVITYDPDELAQRFKAAAAQGGGIVASAHPEYENPPSFFEQTKRGLSDMGKAIEGGWERVRNLGKQKQK